MCTSNILCIATLIASLCAYSNVNSISAKRELADSARSYFTRIIATGLNNDGYIYTFVDYIKLRAVYRAACTELRRDKRKKNKEEEKKKKLVSTENFLLFRLRKNTLTA